jgi:hypothetical protein
MRCIPGPESHTQPPVASPGMAVPETTLDDLIGAMRRLNQDVTDVLVQGWWRDIFEGPSWRLREPSVWPIPRAPEPEPWDVGVGVPWIAWRPGPVYVPVTCTWAPKPVSTVPESTPEPLWKTMQRLLDQDLQDGGAWGIPKHLVVWHDMLMPSWVLYRPVLPRPDTWGC